jgi:hypothetical protein
MRNADSRQLGAFAQQLVDGQALDAGHGGDRLALGASLDHEYRINQCVRRELGLTHEPPRKLVAAHAPQPRVRK